MSLRNRLASWRNELKIKPGIAYFAILVWFVVIAVSMATILIGRGQPLAFLVSCPMGIFLSISLYHDDTPPREEEALAPLVIALLWNYGAVHILDIHRIPSGIPFTLIAYLMIVGVPITFMVRKNFWEASGLKRDDLNAKTLLVSLFGSSIPIGFLLVSIINSEFPLSSLTLNRLITVAIIPPVFEEILLRGIVQEKLTNRFGSYLDAIALTAIVFGLMHIPVYSAYNYTNFSDTILKIIVGPIAGGLLYGAMKALSGSTIPCIITHSAYNTISVLGVSGTMNSILVGLSLIFLSYAIWFVIVKLSPESNDAIRSIY